MGKKIIRLTEQDIRNLIIESLNTIMKDGQTEPLSMEKQLLHIENMTRLLNESQVINNNVLTIKGDTLNGKGEVEFDLTDENNNIGYYVKAYVEGSQTYAGKKSHDILQPDDEPEYDFHVVSLEIVVEDDMNYETIEMTLSVDKNMPAEVQALFAAIESQLDPEYDLEEYNPY